MKTCNKCLIDKPLTSFYAEKNSKDGRRANCSECKDKEVYAWRENNKDKYNSYMRERNKHHYPEYRLKRYGKTDEWFKSTLADQGNGCAICKKKNPSKKRSLAVDHNHLTGRVRGILCYNCNRLLYAFDNVDLFDKILEYILKHKDN